MLASNEMEILFALNHNNQPTDNMQTSKRHVPTGVILHLDLTCTSRTRVKTSKRPTRNKWLVATPPGQHNIDTLVIITVGIPVSCLLPPSPSTRLYFFWCFKIYNWLVTTSLATWSFCYEWFENVGFDRNVVQFFVLDEMLSKQRKNQTEKNKKRIIKTAQR